MGERFPEEYERGRREGAAAADASLGPDPAVAAPAPVAGEPAPAAEEPVPMAAPGGPLPSLGEDRLPLCTEPWERLYVLRRGVLPCSYGSSPIAKMGEYRKAWNGPLLQDIRRDLAAGRFHEYCLSAEACPIVRKSRAAQVLTRGERAFLRVKRLWHGLDRLGGGAPHRLLEPVKRPLAAAVRRITALAGGGS
jgi:hypothetical protein